MPRLLNVVSPQLIKHVTVPGRWGSALLLAAHQKSKPRTLLGRLEQQTHSVSHQPTIYSEFQHRGVEKQRNAPKEKAFQRKRRA